MKFGVIDLVSRDSNCAANKDLSGGMGTRSHFGDGLLARIMQRAKRRSVVVPMLSAAYLVPVIRNRGHSCVYSQDIPEQSCDVFLINTSIIDYRNETAFAERLKARHPRSKVGFFGTFVSAKPELFAKHSDFLVVGEIEAVCLYDDIGREDFFSGEIRPRRTLDMDDLPSPDYGAFPYKRFSYWPALHRRPFVTLHASRGCPFACGYYCPHSVVQGSVYRSRSVDLLIQDVREMIARYGARSIQFRDPVFTLRKDRVHELCQGFHSAGVRVQWGCETRVDTLDRDLLTAMRDAGLRSINLGIEAFDERVMALSRRKAAGREHQNDMVKFCDRIGIKVTAFYIIGLPGDTPETVRRTIDYARKLNTHLAQVTISTPYPGTEYYDELARNNLLLTDDYEQYDINHLVFRHESFSPRELHRVRERFYREYYLRPSYLGMFLKCRIRDFLS
jgi:radical SAM superfamily enzyme YgiQ (UPF0313 family)